MLFHLTSENQKEQIIKYVADRAQFACRILMQDAPTGKQPLAYYSTKLDNSEAGLHPSCQGLAAAAFALREPQQEP